MRTTMRSAAKPATGKRLQPNLSHGTTRRKLLPTPGSEPSVRLKSLVQSLLGSGKGLAISFVYQDEQTHQWANEMCKTIVKLTGTEGVRPSWCRIDDLSAPGILAGAVSTPVRADLIVVATRAEGLPLPFYVWV